MMNLARSKSEETRKHEVENCGENLNCKEWDTHF